MDFSFIEIFAAFMVLFAVIDIPGSIPIILDIKERTGLHILKKVFGVILLAIAVKLFISNTGITLGNAP